MDNILPDVRTFSDDILNKIAKQYFILFKRVSQSIIICLKPQLYNEKVVKIPSVFIHHILLIELSIEIVLKVAKQK